jgi:hypothetical protein
MQGIVGRLSLVISILLISAVLLMAQECALPIDKTVGPGYTSIKFDGRVYRVFSTTAVHLTFSRVNDRIVNLAVKPLKVNFPAPYSELSIQWEPFPTIPLSLDTSGQNDFNLDTETGYAEKVG